MRMWERVSLKGTLEQGTGLDVDSCEFLFADSLPHAFVPASFPNLSIPFYRHKPPPEIRQCPSGAGLHV